MRKVERKRMNSEHKKYFLVGSLCIAIFLMLGIGYAVLSQQLDINGTAQITSNWKILFTSAEEKEMMNATTTRKEITNLTDECYYNEKRNYKSYNFKFRC